MITKENYSLSILPNTTILLDVSKGSWDKKAAEEHFADLKETAKDLVKSGKKWGKLVDLNQWKASTPEAVEVLAENLKWCAANGMVCAAYIIPNPLERMQQQRIVSKGPMGDNVQYFGTQVQAVAWMKEKLG